jgi:outer membrane protein insertion porin family
MRKEFKIMRLFLLPIMFGGFFTGSFCDDEIKKAVAADRISDIKFHKIYPFFSNELFDIMSIYPGSVYDSTKVFGQEDILREYYNGKGYDSVRVSIESERRSKKLVKLDIEIIKSDFFGLDKIKLKGNKYFSDFRLKKELKTYWRSWLPWKEPGRFIPDEFETDKKKIEDFYRKRGFADIEIENSYKKNYADKTADITFDIDEGPLYYIKDKRAMIFFQN